MNRCSIRRGVAVAIVMACPWACGGAVPAPDMGDAAAPMNRETCRVVPEQHENDETYRKAAGDLHARILSSADVGASLNAEQRQTVEATFQAIPDKNQACAMLMATYACLGQAGKESLAISLLETINATCANGGAASSATCDGQRRAQLDCAAEAPGKGADGQDGAAAATSGAGAASSGTEKKALKAIDQQTILFVAEARRLCDEYNKCVVDRDTYATRTENLRRRMAKVPELLDRMRGASTEEARRVALGDAYRSIVPDNARTELRLDFAALARRPTESAMTPLPAGGRAPTGTRMAFVVRVSRSAYVYLFEKASSGAVNVLFPDARIGITNPVPPGDGLRIPPGEASFKLDDKDLGTESVYMVASLKPVTELAEAARRAAPGGAPPAGVLARVAAIDPRCTSRGLALDEADAPAPTGCVRSRGLSLDTDTSAAGAASSLSAITEAADDTIATVFQFEHSAN